jgi:hypothetical protein
MSRVTSQRTLEVVKNVKLNFTSFLFRCYFSHDPRRVKFIVGYVQDIHVTTCETFIIIPYSS